MISDNQAVVPPNNLFFKFEKIIFLIFLCFLPFEVFPFLHFSFSSIGYYSFDFYVHVFGLALLCASFFDKRFRYFNKLVIYLVCLCFFLTLLSLINAFLAFDSFNGYYSTNPYLVVLYESFKYFHFVSIFFYTTYFIRFVTKKELLICFFVTIFVVFFVSGIQAIYLFSKNQILGSFYDRFASFFGFQLTTFFTKQGGRVCGPFREPAHSDLFFGCFLIPSLLSWALVAKNKKTKDFVIFAFLMVGALFIVYLAKSTSLYFAVFFDFVVFFVVFLARVRNPVTKKRIVGITFIAACLLIAGLFSTAIGKTIYSSMIEKAFSSTNDSTLFRYSYAYSDLKTFLRMPLIGCGNGMQGYYYFNNIVGTRFSGAIEAVLALTGKLGLIYGGGFIPAYLSGFGICGLVIGFPVVSLFLKDFRSLSKQSAFLYTMLAIALPVLLVMLCVSDELTMNYQACVLFSVPYVCLRHEDAQCGSVPSEEFRKI